MFKSLDLSGNEKSNTPEGDAEKVKCLIVGSGPAGYTAAIYAAPR